MPDVLLQVLAEGSRFAILAIAVTIALSVSRHIDLSLGVPVLAAAYAAAMVIGRFGVPVFSWVCPLVAMAGVGAGFGWLVFDRSGVERLAGPPRLLLSLALIMIAENAVSLVIGDEPIFPADGLWPAWWAVGQRSGRWTLVALAVVVWAAVVLSVRYIRWGRFIRAFRSDPVLCRAVGVPIRQLSAYAFAVAFVLAALGGILTSLDTALTPGFAFQYLLMSIIAAVIGGSTEVTGAFLGAYAVAALRAAATWWLGSQWSDLTAVTLLVVVALVEPWAGAVRKRLLGGSVPRAQWNESGGR